MKILVVGLGKLGQAVATALTEGKADVIGLDRDMACVDAARDAVGVVVQADATDPDAVRGVGGAEADLGIVAIGTDFEDSVLSVAVLKEVAVKRVIARANSQREARILRLVGADDVIFVEQELGRRIAKRILSQPS